jgi:hypothetical protein
VPLHGKEIKGRINSSRIFDVSEEGIQLNKIFQNIFAEKFGKQIGVFTRNSASLWKMLIVTLVFMNKTLL